MWVERTGVLLVAALLLAAGPAAAQNLLKFQVLGVRLGQSQAEVRNVYPDLFADTYDYEHPEVGFRYEAVFGRRVADTIEARGLARGEGGTEVELTLRFTGDERLFELQAWERHEGRVDCAQEMADLIRRYGDPDVKVQNELVQWIERSLEVERILEVQCFPAGRTVWRLADDTALEGWRDAVARGLTPYVNQVRQP